MTVAVSQHEHYAFRPPELDVYSLYEFVGITLSFWYPPGVAAVDSVVLLPMLEIAPKDRWQTKWRRTFTVMASRTLKTPRRWLGTQWPPCK